MCNMHTGRVGQAQDICHRQAGSLVYVFLPWPFNTKLPALCTGAPRPGSQANPASKGRSIGCLFMGPGMLPRSSLASEQNSSRTLCWLPCNMSRLLRGDADSAQPDYRSLKVQAGSPWPLQTGAPLPSLTGCCTTIRAARSGGGPPAPPRSGRGSQRRTGRPAP